MSAPQTDSFGDGTTTSARPQGRRRRMLLGAAGVAAVATAIAIAYFATRDAAPGAAAMEGHNHAAMVAGGDGGGKPVSLDAGQAERIGVTYATATTDVLRKEVRTVGQITFDETRVRAISPKIEGWVERLYVNATGQPVRAGQPLLAIYSPMLVTAQEELLLARRLVGEVSGADDAARASAADLLSSARRRLAYWDIPADEIAAVERSGEVRRTLTLRAPTGGYVLEKNILQGQRIMPGDALYRVADLSVVWVEGEVFEQDLAAVQVGQMVHADFQALPGEHRMGRIAYVYPTLDPETRTARVRVELPNPGLALKPGMYATIRIEGAPREDVLSIPRTAVLVTGERTIVFVREADGRLMPRDVRLGVTTDERVEVLAGLAKGETVVASATFLIDAESNLGSALGAMGDTSTRSAMPPGTDGPSTIPVPPRNGATPPRAAPPPATDHSKMDHSKMDHSSPDQSSMDPPTMDHSTMDHSGMELGRKPAAAGAGGDHSGHEE